MSRSLLQLTAALSMLVLFVIVVTGVLVERGISVRNTAEIEQSMAERARLVVEWVDSIPLVTENAAVLDAIADRAEPAARARVTLIGANGEVVGDSQVPLEKLVGVANHADRPEVALALGGSMGSSSRLSETVGRRFLYLAVPARGPDGGAVRLAADLSGLGADAWAVRSELLSAGGIGLLAALALAVAFSWLTLRPLRELQRAAASIAGGDFDSRVNLRSIDELGGISTAINDLAKQVKRQLENLAHEKEQLRAVLNGMVEGVLVVDADGRVLLANARMREFYALVGEVEGRSVLEVVRDVEVDQILEEAGATDEPVSRRFVGVAAGGRTFRVHAARFHANGGPRAGTVAVFHDVSEVARLEAVRRDFVANASHELRTPVAAIRGFAETLQTATTITEEERGSYLEIIQRHATRLGNLVADLLQLSTIEGREAVREPDHVDVSEVAATSIRDMAELVAARGLHIDLAADGPAPAWVRREDLEQVLGNLVGNAINYTDEGGRIEIRVAGDAEHVELTVADSGIGISREDQDRIFERFYRVDATRSRAAGGTGLGLSIVRHLVLGMGGEVSVESRLGRGTTFTVRLPRDRPKGP